MILSGKNIGIGITGSFCTFDKIIPPITKLKELEANVSTVFSDNAKSCDTRFCEAEDFLKLVYQLTGNEPITTIVDAEPVGPKNLFDIFIIAPATGNTIAKLANAITDTPVLMAAKAHLRNNKPVVISVSTNDALSMNFKNIGTLYNTKNIFFVPFGQDNYRSKPNSMVADVDQMIPTIEKALEGKQIQPVIILPQ
ncbi:dipicolinate synthase subunit B [Sedimentibacter hydroxybenzoicus DSM 7310]|uniref:Dipicolinate synthase subunit B n=1 Tax=Sedimentibacter hydroxybenzoicus DSM 7310 TaxID=1123245 RepID=A0A974BKK2_SEDHY|nr:dipicolinate synthase subunit B [Sedimentibacter hydroxybenzoicus]NYB75015.1 dipicolinate synthase subunit B [Sedimentibacter hydroxybenzoicus DSM 7310]